jgi:hypothetical protein
MEETFKKRGKDQAVSPTMVYSTSVVRPHTCTLVLVHYVLQSLEKKTHGSYMSKSSSSTSPAGRPVDASPAFANVPHYIKSPFPILSFFLYWPNAQNDQTFPLKDTHHGVCNLSTKKRAGYCCLSNELTCIDTGVELSLHIVL